MNKEKVKRFVKDQDMVDSVLGVIQQSFMKPRQYKDVHYLAAKSLCLEFLEEAKKDLARYKDDEQKGTKGTTQIGL